MQCKEHNHDWGTRAAWGRTWTECIICGARPTEKPKDCSFVRESWGGNAVSYVGKDGHRLIQYSDGEIVDISERDEERTHCKHEHVMLVTGVSGYRYRVCKDCQKTLLD